jgi:hypothetical protein
VWWLRGLDSEACAPPNGKSFRVSERIAIRIEVFRRPHYLSRHAIATRLIELEVIAKEDRLRLHDAALAGLFCVRCIRRNAIV